MGTTAYSTSVCTNARSPDKSLGSITIIATEYFFFFISCQYAIHGCDYVAVNSPPLPLVAENPSD